MILKVVKQKQIYNDEECETSLITSYYESKNFEEKDGFMFTDKETIPITNFEGIDEITNKVVKFNVCEVYLMNNEGKTIERIN